MKMKNILDELVLCYYPITVICCFVSYLTSNNFEIQRISALGIFFFCLFFLLSLRVHVRGCYIDKHTSQGFVVYVISSPRYSFLKC